MAGSNIKDIRKFAAILWLIPMSLLIACSHTQKIETAQSPDQEFMGPTFDVPNLTWPVMRGTITDVFGRDRGDRIHKGMDIAREHGSPIYAARAGKVTFRGFERGYGRFIELTHNNGWTSRYAHLSAFKVGWSQQVEKGQIIGHMGQTGRASGTHLHFEVRHYNVPKNPIPYLPKPQDIWIDTPYSYSSPLGFSKIPTQGLQLPLTHQPAYWLL